MKFSLTVSEPWDFKSATGGNSVAADLVKLIDSRRGVFKLKESIRVNGLSGCFLLLSVRFADASFDGFKLPLVVNGSLLVSYDGGLDCDELIRSSKFVLIGSLHQGIE